MWGERSFLRRTLSTPARNKALVLLLAVHRDADRLAELKDNADLRLPELGDLAKWLGDGYSSEAGWETARLNDAIKAATTTTQLPGKTPEA